MQHTRRGRGGVQWEVQHTRRGRGDVHQRSVGAWSFFLRSSRKEGRRFISEGGSSRKVRGAALWRVFESIVFRR